MSIIVPAGNMRLDWSPKGEEDKVLVKTASADSKQVVKDDTTALYEAAEKVVADQKKKAEDKAKTQKTANMMGEVLPPPCGASPCGDMATDMTTDVAPVSTEPISTDVEPMPAPLGEEKSDGEKGGLQEAVEKIEEAVAEIKDSIEIEVNEEVDEVELELDDESKGEEKGEGEGEEKGEGEGEEKGDDIVVESEEPAKPEKKEEACASTKSAMEKSASTDDSEEFCKFAKLSPENRKKVADYWVRMLGFPKDYVSLMVKDYEG